MNLSGSKRNYDPESESDSTPPSSFFGFTSSRKKMKPTGDDIFVLIGENKIKEIGVLIDEYPSIIYTEKNERTPTNFSVKNRGISVPYRIEHGDTPLTFAINYGRIEIIKLLFEKGVTVQYYYDKNILLLTRILMGEEENNTDDLETYFDVLSILIKNGSDVNEVDSNGISLLEKLLGKVASIPSDQSFLIKTSWLLRMGADPNICRKDGYTHIFHAIYHNHIDIIIVLLDEYEFTEKTSDILDKYGDNKIPTNVNKGNENTDISPLTIAITNGSFEMFKFLLAHGANINYITSDADTVLGAGANLLHYACFYIQIDICEELIKNNEFDVNQAVTSTGDTPIIIVMRKANSKNRSRALIEKLIGYGGDPDKKNKKGETPISIAVKRADLSLLGTINLTMKSGTLELQSRNQELQSTNQKLESSKKESYFLVLIITILFEYEVNIDEKILKSVKTPEIGGIINNRLDILSERNTKEFEKTEPFVIKRSIFPIVDFFTLKEYNSIYECLNDPDEYDTDENGDMTGNKNNKIIMINNRMYCINKKLLFDTYFKTRKMKYDHQSYACTKILPNEYPDRTKIDWEKGSLFNLRKICPIAGFVSYNLFYSLLKSNIKLFAFIDTYENIVATTGIQMLHEDANAIGSARCQRETDGKLYIIQELRIKSNMPQNAFAFENKYKKTMNSKSINSESRNGGRNKSRKQKYTRKSTRRRAAK